MSVDRLTERAALITFWNDWLYRRHPSDGGTPYSLTPMTDGKWIVTFTADGQEHQAITWPEQLPSGSLLVHITLDGEEIQ